MRLLVLLAPLSFTFATGPGKPKAVSVEARERPAIRRLLERALKAQKAKNWDALRECMTRSSIADRERRARDSNDSAFHGVFLSGQTEAEPQAIQLESLEVDAKARWAVVTTRGPETTNANDRKHRQDSTFDLLIEDGKWKLEPQIEDDKFNWESSLGTFWSLYQGKAMPQLRPAPTLEQKRVAASEMSAGWTMEPDTADMSGYASVTSIVEALRFKLFHEQDGARKEAGEIEYFMLEDSTRAAWMLWKHTRNRKVMDVHLGDESWMDVRSQFIAFRSGRYYVNVTIHADVEQLDRIAREAVAKLKG